LIGSKRFSGFTGPSTKHLWEERCLDNIIKIDAPFFVKQVITGVSGFFGEFRFSYEELFRFIWSIWFVWSVWSIWFSGLSGLFGLDGLDGLDV